MAEKKKAYYTVNKKEHVVTIDTSVTPTKEDEKEVNLLVSLGGYDMRFKSKARAAAMKAKSTDGLNADAIKEALKNDKAALKKFDDIIHGAKTGVTNADGKKGFFAAKKWYLKEYLPSKK